MEEQNKQTDLEFFIELMDKVYGECKDEISAETWSPKLFKEGQGRYLLTDAFGVCNYLTLYCETKEKKYLIQAEKLVQNVHDILGYNRDKKSRLSPATAENPTLGGLRIGKPDAENTEDGDGQYFHYITKWMFALNRMSKITKDKKYNQWAVDLAKAVHKYFVYDLEEYFPKIYWKISIDRQRPLIESSGMLDPFDGYVNYRLVQSDSDDPECLSIEISQLEKIVKVMYKNYQTTDPLDLGEALWLTHFYPSEVWSSHLIDVSNYFLTRLQAIEYFKEPEEQRLAFRELGTCLGIKVQQNCSADKIQEGTKDLVQNIMMFWKDKLFSIDNNITPIMYCAAVINGVFCNNFFQNK